MKPIKTPQQLKDALVNAGIILVAKGNEVAEVPKDNFSGIFTEYLTVADVTVGMYAPNLKIQAKGNHQLVIHKSRKSDPDKEEKARLFYLSDHMDYSLK